MALIKESNQRLTEAEVHRVAGEVLLASAIPDRRKAEAHFAHALTVARQQQAKSWELRASMSMAQLWRDQGSRSKLANCLLRFTAGSLKASTRAT